MTEVGPVQVEVPRDRHGSFEPVIVRKRQRRLDGVDGIVLSLSAKGLTTGEISAHLAEVYGASKETISAITDRVVESMGEWQSRPLDPGQVLAIVANQDLARWRVHCCMIAFGDDALEFLHLTQPAAAVLLTLGFVWSVILTTAILSRQARTPLRAVAAAVPIGLALVSVLFVWLHWYATGTVIDVT